MKSMRHMALDDKIWKDSASYRRGDTTLGWLSTQAVASLACLAMPRPLPIASDVVLPPELSPASARGLPGLVGAEGAAGAAAAGGAGFAGT
jgi:hypothetical protein